MISGLISDEDLASKIIAKAQTMGVDDDSGVVTDIALYREVPRKITCFSMVI
jgi:hypothetical protein